MASYESDLAAVTESIDTALAAGSVSQATADAIKSIVADLETSGQAVVVDQVTTNIESAAQVTGEVVMMDANTSANVTFDANSNVQAMVVGGAGNSNVVFETSKDVTVQLQGGANDSVSTGSGNDSITFTGGTATIDTGEGDDTVVLQGGTGGGYAELKGGSGNMNIKLEVDLAVDGVTASIDAGDGFDSVSMNQGREGHFFSFLNGVFKMVKQAIMARDGDAADDQGGIQMQNVNVVQFTDGMDDDGNDIISDITILADTKGEAMVGRLYQVALGRMAIDHTGEGDDGSTILNGLNYWIEEFGAGNDDVDLNHLAHSFVNCDEFNNKYASMSAEDFANAMFNNLNMATSGAPITEVNGMTAADYAAQIASGAMSMQDAAIEIANSQEAVKVMGVDGSQYVIDGYSTGDAQ